jgi:AcrR family transcriptional regulator
VLRKSSIYELTISKIATEAGLARPTAYRYFSHPRDIVNALVEELMRDLEDAASEVGEADSGAAYACTVVTLFTADSVVNRQILLLAGDPATGPCIPEQLTPEAMLVKFGLPADEFHVPLTYFRGALYSWAVGSFTDEQFAAETERAFSMTGKDL